jgi:hypothetical protein
LQHGKPGFTYGCCADPEKLHAAAAVGPADRLLGENAVAFFLSWRKIRNLLVRANAEYHPFSACQHFFAKHSYFYFQIFFEHPEF